MMRRKLCALALTVLVAATLAACASPKERYLDWSTYPAAAGLKIEDVLENSAESEINDHAEKILTAMMTALEAEHHVTAWQALSDATLVPYGENGYGGDSLLLGFTAPIWQSESPVPASEWEQLLTLAREVGADFGLAPIDQGIVSSDYMNQLTLTDGTSYLDVLVVDMSRDDNYRKRAEADSATTQGVSLTYGAVVIPQDKRDAFQSAAEPFIGEPLPER